MKFLAYLSSETEFAVLIRPQGRRADMPDIWLPKSQITMKKYPASEEGRLHLCEFEIPEWLGNEKGI